MRRWVPLGAAVALAGVLIAAVLLTRGEPRVPGGDSGSPAASTPAGWRQVSYRDVVVAVPPEWGYDYAPGSDWCADGGGDRVPEGPYVDVSGSYDAVLAIGCTAPRPPSYDVTHLEFADASADDVPTSEERPGWSSVSRHVGAVVVTVWFDPAHEDVARQVVDSARLADVDPNGCAVTSPIQAGHFARPVVPFRVEDVTSVDAISVCQYDIRSGTGVPGLLASRRISGAAADAVLTAVQRAPIGGGPDQPQQCSDDQFGDTALVLRLVSGDELRDLYVYMESCRGNGFDDGTTLRELTPAACRPLWELPVRLISGHSESFARCHD
jgi:hypothetical protein